MVAKGKRAEAKALGLPYYETGEPCANGHIAKRITANGQCHECFLEAKRVKRSSKKGYRTRTEMDAERLQPMRKCSACKKEFPATEEFFVLLKKTQPSGIITTGLARECRECRNKRYKTFYLAHRDKVIAAVAKNVQEHPERKRNRDMQRYMRRKKHNGCPPWADQQKIETIYAIADFLTRMTGIPHEVDHVWPLIHPRSCGLHVPWNLRVITREANQRKGNRLPDALSPPALPPISDYARELIGRLGT